MQGMPNNVFMKYDDSDNLGDLYRNALDTYISQHNIFEHGTDELTFFEFTLQGDAALPIPDRPQGNPLYNIPYTEALNNMNEF